MRKYQFYQLHQSFNTIKAIALKLKSFETIESFQKEKDNFKEDTSVKEL